jgi:hypothetical protein
MFVPAVIEVCRRMYKLKSGLYHNRLWYPTEFKDGEMSPYPPVILIKTFSSMLELELTG